MRQAFETRSTPALARCYPRSFTFYACHDVASAKVGRFSQKLHSASRSRACGIARIPAALSGYSARNLKYMRAFAQAWPEPEIVHQLGAQFPWKHNCVLIDRVKDAELDEEECAS